MGTYNCTPGDIYDAFENALDNLQGEVYIKTVQEAFDRLMVEYPYFTDKKTGKCQLQITKSKFKIGDYVEYKATKTESVAGTVIGIYTTTFGSKKRGVALRLQLDKPRLGRKVTSVSEEKCDIIPNFKSRR